MKKLYFTIRRNGADCPQQVYDQLEEQTDFLRPDCCGGGISLDDVKNMMADGYITLEDDQISVWY